MTLDESENKEPEIATNSFLEPKESYFWVAGAPLFSSFLTLTPTREYLALPEAERKLVSGPLESDLSFHRSDGLCVENAKLKTDVGRQSNIDIGFFMERIPMHAGVKHGQLIVRHPAMLDASLSTRLLKSGAERGERRTLVRNGVAFFPCRIGPGVATLVIVSNHGPSEARVKCRVFYGKRQPERNIDIPPYGTQLISLNAEVLDIQSEEEAEEDVQSYLRLTCMTEHRVSVQCFEQLRDSRPTQQRSYEDRGSMQL